MEELLSSDFFSADFIANGSSEELNFREFEFNSEPTQKPVAHPKEKKDGKHKTHSCKFLGCKRKYISEKALQKHYKSKHECDLSLEILETEDTSNFVKNFSILNELDLSLSPPDFCFPLSSVSPEFLELLNFASEFGCSTNAGEFSSIKESLKIEQELRQTLERENQSLKDELKELRIALDCEIHKNSQIPSILQNLKSLLVQKEQEFNSSKILYFERLNYFLREKQTEIQSVVESIQTANKRESTRLITLHQIEWESHNTTRKALELLQNQNFQIQQELVVKDSEIEQLRAKLNSSEEEKDSFLKSLMDIQRLIPSHKIQT